VTATPRRPGVLGLASGLRHAARAQRIELELGRAVPGWTLRVGLGGVGGLLVALSRAADLPLGPTRVFVAMALVGLVAAAGVAVVRPGSPAVGVLVVVVGLFEIGRPAGFTARTFVLILLVHVVLRVAAVAAQAGWRARVEVAVLAAQVREVAVVQAGVQVLALAAASVPLVTAGANGGGVGAWVRVAAVGGVLALVVLLLPRTWLRSRG
jgi:hypothetical protein